MSLSRLIVKFSLKKKKKKIKAAGKDVNDRTGDEPRIFFKKEESMVGM
jgi:hypothetical protein